MHTLNLLRNRAAELSHEERNVLEGAIPTSRAILRGRSLFARGC